MNDFERKAIMVACAATNLDHMRTTPAGEASPSTLVKLYQRMAIQGLSCAQAWQEGKPCPPHEPAVDAFWWGVAAWAGVFSNDLLQCLELKDKRRLHYELQEVFCRPHREFACWLRPLDPREAAGVLHDYNPVTGISAVQLVLAHDIAWTRLVMRLTARWGLLRHVSDLPALWQSLTLVRRLERWPDPLAQAYLESDLLFFRRLFAQFPFSPRLRAALDEFISAAERESSR